MAQTSRDVEIGLKARDAYSGEFEKLSKRIEGVRRETAAYARQISAQTKSMAGDVARSIFGVEKGMRAIDDSFKAVTTSIEDFRRGSITAFDAAMRSAEGFIESLQKIPVAGSLGSLLAQGVDAIMPGLSMADEARNRAAVDALIERTAIEERIANEREAIAERSAAAIKKTGEAIRKQLEIESISTTDRLGTEGFDRRMAQLRQEELDRFAELKRLREAASDDAQRAEIDRLKKHLGDLFDLRFQALRDEQAREVFAMQEARRAEHDRHRAELDRRLEREREAAAREAEIQRRAREAAAADERLRAFNASRLNPGIEAIEGRFITRAPQSAFAESNSHEARRIAELKQLMREHLAETKRTNESLARIERDKTIIRVENN